jgi:hypothetical protein
MFYFDFYLRCTIFLVYIFQKMKLRSICFDILDGVISDRKDPT